MPGQNEIIATAKKHWSEYAKMKKQLTLSAAFLARSQKLKPVTGRVRIHFDWYEENKRRDPDNIRAGGTKFIVDGLMKAEILPQDGWSIIAGLSDTFHVDKENPRIEILLEEVNSEPE